MALRPPRENSVWPALVTSPAVEVTELTSAWLAASTLRIDLRDSVPVRVTVSWRVRAWTLANTATALALLELLPLEKA